MKVHCDIPVLTASLSLSVSHTQHQTVTKQKEFFLAHFKAKPVSCTVMRLVVQIQGELEDFYLQVASLLGTHVTVSTCPRESIPEILSLAPIKKVFPLSSASSNRFRDTSWKNSRKISECRQWRNSRKPPQACEPITAIEFRIHIIHPRKGPEACCVL